MSTIRVRTGPRLAWSWTIGCLTALALPVVVIPEHMTGEQTAAEGFYEWLQECFHEVALSIFIFVMAPEKSFLFE